MSREVVRRLAADKTHLADVEGETRSSFAGREYRRPFDGTKTLCGVKITNGVIMREGVPSRCVTCNMLAKREIDSKSPAELWEEGAREGWTRYRNHTLDDVLARNPYKEV